MNRRRMLVRWRRSLGGRTNTRVARHVQRTLIAGSFLLIPVAITYLILRLGFDALDGVLRPVTSWAFPDRVWLYLYSWSIWRVSSSPM